MVFTFSRPCFSTSASKTVKTSLSTRTSSSGDRPLAIRVNSTMSANIRVTSSKRSAISGSPPRRRSAIGSGRMFRSRRSFSRVQLLGPARGGDVRAVHVDEVEGRDVDRVEGEEAVARADFHGPLASGPKLIEERLEELHRHLLADPAAERIDDVRAGRVGVGERPSQRNRKTGFGFSSGNISIARRAVTSVP